MNKITKKLFAYFAIVSLVLAITVFIGFYGVFRYYSLEHHEEELHTRAETIKARVEAYMDEEDAIHKLNAYIEVLDDISMADAYFVIKNGRYFATSCSCNASIEIDKLPTKEVATLAKEIFETGEYKQIEEKGTDNNTIIRVGIPVIEDKSVTAVVVIEDTFVVDQKSFVFAISVLLGSILLAVILSNVFSATLAKHFMKPIQKIALTIKELSKGNYQVKTEVHDNNEIGELAKEADILAKKLDNASKESERMEQMQKEYIANISHELRTPVSVIRSSIEALHDGMVPEEKVTEYQSQMLSETIALQRLVNDMLEISRLENKDFPIEKEQLDLGFVLEDAIRGIRMLAREKDIQIHYEGIESEWMFEGDYGRLRQMFIAVLDNAIKYSETGKNIWITTKEMSEYYQISIRDEGFGIAKDMQEHIFDKFYRASHGKTSGTGLGMAIVKSIADRHNIEIQVDSVEEKGTVIVFDIPVRFI